MAFTKETQLAKNLCNYAVNIAKREGIIIWANKCSTCQSNKYVVLHHIDYNKPLNVIPLCRKCHHAWHCSSMATQPDEEHFNKKWQYYYNLGISQLEKGSNMTGEELRKWRINQGLTQPAAALKIGVSLPTYKRWESGRYILRNIPIPAERLINYINN